MKSMKYLLFLSLSAFVIGCASSKTDQQMQTGQSQANEDSLALTEKLPVDPHVRTGTLDNGMKYYIRQNDKPEGRAQLRLVVNAGSILEKPDQQGLAHFVEHMAFNGTEHFQKQELVNFLESIGMRFGADINAYTSFDETVYMLEVPTDSTALLDKGFLVLQDWASALSFNHEEIDKERGVVKEEWRLGRGANSRMRDEQFPILFKGSRYAERLPIGKKAVLDTFQYQTLIDFYNTWYRPDLMAVVAVGDFNPDSIKQLIVSHLGSISNPDNEKQRKLYPVPDHDSTLFAIAADSEATRSSVGIYYKLPSEKEETVQDYRQGIVEQLYNTMLNQRLQEKTLQKNPPFVYAYSTKGQFVRTREFYILGAGVQDNGIPRGLGALLTSAKQVQQFGFTETELERGKQMLIRGIEQSYNERDKTRSRRFASEYIRAFLYGEPIPGITYEYRLYQKYAPTISLEEVNNLANKWLNDKSRVIMANSPEKEGVDVPTKSGLLAVLDSVQTETVKPYVDVVSSSPLLPELPEPSKVVGAKEYQDMNVTEWTLGNGVKVVLKPTDFKNDEVRFTAFSFGGMSLLADSDIIPAQTATGIVRQSGIGQFDQVELQKMLSDKIVNVNPSLGRLSEGISGSASPQDLETMFQLIYLYMTSPRKNSSAYESYKSRLAAYYQNRSASPEAAFHDTITATITQHNPRFMPFTVGNISKLDLDKSLKIYKDRFSDARGFTFVFVGNFDTTSIRPFVEQYLGGLPSTSEAESWRDVTYDYPKGVIERTVKRGMEPKSLNSINFTGTFNWTPENEYLAHSMLSVLRIKLRERVREDLGGSYGVSVSGNFNHYPRERYRISISFGSNPDRVKELTNAVYSVIDSLKQFGTTDKYLEKVQEIQIREYETNLKENGYWLNHLESDYYDGLNPERILQRREQINSLTLDAIQKAAQQYFDMNNIVRVVLYPEDYESQ